MKTDMICGRRWRDGADVKRVVVIPGEAERRDPGPNYPRRRAVIHGSRLSLRSAGMTVGDCDIWVPDRRASRVVRDDIVA